MSEPWGLNGNGRGSPTIYDRAGARAFLRTLSAESGNMAQLRRVLLDSHGHLDVSRLSDRQVIDLLSSSMRGGVLSLTRRHLRIASVGGTPTGEAAVEDEVAAAALEQTERSTIRFQVVEDATLRPISGVPLTVTLPDGREDSRTTDGEGLIEINDLEDGTCSLRSEREGARLASTWSFVEMGLQGVAPGGGEGRAPLPRKPRLLVVSEHRVETGETLGSVAAQYGMTWQELAEYNWDTRDPDEINEHLHDEVGCTEKTDDGANFVFRTEDQPGIVFIPEPWSRDGLETGKRHTIRVKRVARFFLILESEEQIRLPDVEYTATFADGTEREGRLGTSGIGVIEDPPPGEIEVVYADNEDIHAKALAGAARQAFDERVTGPVFRLLDESPEMVRVAIEAYDTHWNDHSGQGFLQDLDLELIEEEPRLLASTLLAIAELQPLEEIELLEEPDEDPPDDIEYGYPA